MDVFNNTFDNISFSTFDNSIPSNHEEDINKVSNNLIDKTDRSKLYTPNISSDEPLFSDENDANESSIIDSSSLLNLSLETSLLKACQAAFIKPTDSSISLDDTPFLLESQSQNLPEETLSNTLKSSLPPLEEDTKETSTELCKLTSWGLPTNIIEVYTKKNITTMFKWQVNCLNNQKVLKNGNLVYSAPTSAGKTLVAEFLAIKTVLERKKKVIFILPFVSVVREKMFYFQELFSGSGIRVEGFMGSYNPPGGFQSIQIAICTIEKANGLINRLLQEEKLQEIGCVIVDEIHLIGDSSRGYLLELFLTKLKYMMIKNPVISIQIIGMSATLPNLPLLANWLDAQLFVTNFRPVPLDELYLVDNQLFNNTKFIRQLDLLPDLDSDTDNILQLCLETLKDSCSVLIFCPTKNWCENLALQISSAFWKLGMAKTPWGLILREQLNSNLISDLLQQLKRSPVGLDSILGKTVAFGVAFHHAGLTLDERDIIECSFKSNTIRVLIATSTLSSGVNLPAKRVIIRTPLFHGKPLDSLTYRQMIGRAGRMGKDSSGESILICQSRDRLIAQELLSANLQPVESCLEGEGKLKRALLEIIASGVAKTHEDVLLFANSTLLSSSRDFHERLLEDSIEFLKRNEFIRLQDFEYKATSLGKACLMSSLPPEDGLALLSEVEKARECFVLENELHIIYLVTPYSACNQWSNIDWMLYFQLWEKLSPSMKRVGELIGVRDFYIINATRGKIDLKKLNVHKRFFISLALQDLVNEIPLNQVAIKFNCNRGLLQSLQQSASTFAGMLTTFSKQLGWSAIEILVGQFQDRLQFGVNRDLLDLMRLSLLNGPTARSLYNSHVETLAQLANSTTSDIEDILMKSVPFESEQREGESKFQSEKRKKAKGVWITGKEGVTEKVAAEMLIKGARDYLKLEMGLIDVKWEEKTNESFEKLNKNDSGLGIGNLSIHEENKENLIDNSYEQPSCSYKRNFSPGFEETPSKRKKIQKRKVLDELNIVNVCANRKLFLIFTKELLEQTIISLSVACIKHEENLQVIGVLNKTISSESFTYKDRKVEGIVISWGENSSYYLHLEQKNKVQPQEVLENLQKVFNKRNLHLRIFDAKEQIKVLNRCCNLNFFCLIEDPKVGDWLMQPDEKEKNLQALALNYYPQSVQLSQLVGTCKGVGSLGLDVSTTIDAKIRAGIEACICLHLTQAVRNKLEEQPGLGQVFDTEMECILHLARMELYGFGVDLKKFQDLAETIKEHTINLEKEAYSLAGRHFSFTSSTDVSKVLGLYQYGKKSSNSKQVLQQQTNPIASIILLWRKLNSTLTKMIYPLIRLIDNGRIYGNSLTHNTTGRISMHEPNLQNIPKTFNVKDQIICCRSAFVAQEGNIFISADYCQLELRLLAHFSQDLTLCSIMRDKSDVFKSIAARWHNIDELEVSDTQRQWAKQVCYGIIYGMGKKSLAEQLNTSEEEAGQFMESFHVKYPRIKKFTEETIKGCSTVGYVTTLVGRRRYLPNIHHENPAVKAQAERQAVNTVIQGSAADIAKRAMISIEKNISRYIQPKLVLHLHDELLYEVPSKYLISAGKYIKESMEKTVTLSIPFPVKVKSGKHWGEMSELF